MAIKYFPAYQMLRLPFDFQVKDRLDNPAIYIVNAGLELSQELTLHLKNVHFNPMYFAPIDLSTVDWEPTSDTCHFELRFRKGVLSNATLGTSKDKHLKNSWLSTVITNFQKKSPYKEGSWAISKPEVKEENGWVSFYLTKMIKGKYWKFDRNEEINITLTNISAALGEGTRETRVAIFPRRIYYREDSPFPPDLTDDKKGKHPVHEPKEQVLQIINQLGKPNIPLHVGFIGPNKVLNDGTQHSGYTLTLRILNTSHHDSIEFDEKSHFIFEFEHTIAKDENGEYEDMEEALGTPENLGKISFHYAKEKPTKDEYLMERPDSDVMAKSPHWIFYPLKVENREGFQFLEYEKHWDIVINLDQFSTTQPAGITFLKIKCINIPGYWDVELRAPIEKTPLLIDTELIPDKNNDKIVTLEAGRRPVSLNSELALLLKTNSIARMVIDAEGNVGIGSLNPKPDEKLQVNHGSIKVHSNEYDNKINPNSLVITNDNITGIAISCGKTRPSIKSFYGKDLVIDASKLHVFIGASNTSTHDNAAITLENNNHVYLNLLAPNDKESGILFGHSNKATHGGIIYNNGSVKNGLSFRTNGNVTRMVIDAEGNVGIGHTPTPKEKLHVEHGKILISGNQGMFQISDSGFVMENANKKSGLQVQCGSSTTIPSIRALHNKYLHISGGKVIIESYLSADPLEVRGSIDCKKIKIGNTEIDETALRVLKALAAGQLEIKIMSKQGFYLASHEGKGGWNDNGDGWRTVEFSYHKRYSSKHISFKIQPDHNTY